MASNIPGHTVKAFDDDMRTIRALVAEMGGLAEAAINDAMIALTRRRAWSTTTAASTRSKPTSSAR